MRRILYVAIATLFLCGCEKDDKETPPVVETVSTVASRPASEVTVTGIIREAGSPAILDYGFVYSGYSQGATLENGIKVSLGKVPPVKVPIVAHIPMAWWSSTYVRMYLTNTKGTVYGEVLYARYN